MAARQVRRRARLNMSMTPSRRTLEKVTLGDLAADGRLVVVHCNLCRKTEHYLAVDLVQVMGAGQSAYGAFDRCPHCGNGKWLRIQFRLASYLDEGKLRIRRPVAKRRWVWRDAIYRKVDAERVEKPDPPGS